MITPGEKLDWGAHIPEPEEDVVMYASLPTPLRERLLFGAGEPITHKLVSERLGHRDLTYVDNLGWVASASLMEDPPEQLSFELPV